MMAQTGARVRVICACWAAIFICGCSTLTQTGPNSLPPLRTYEAVVPDHGPHLLEVDDPIEGLNRGTYRFNYYLDEYLYHPVVRAYEIVLPDYVKDRLSDALDNIGEFGNLTNNLFQTKLKDAGITVSRIIINSTVGFAGLWDPATAMGLTRKPADFGQTLGHYGVGSGPYLVLPGLGPSNVRDATGLAADSAAFSLVGPIAWVNEPAVSGAFWGISALDKRHRIPFRYHQTGSPFEYDLLRMLYTIKREFDVAH
jgi:phospholipid-binding lipoprotein MlaA